MPIGPLLRTGALWGALLLAGCTCAHVPQPREFPGTRRLYPFPTIYFRWWKKTEECSGIKKSMRVSFYVVPLPHLGPHPDLPGHFIIGRYVADSSLITGRLAERIYFAQPWMYTEWLVRHEMLHSLLRSRGVTEGHPYEYFVVKCALTAEQNPGRPSPPPLSTSIQLPPE
jgi:hypothetical protein